MSNRFGERLNIESIIEQHELINFEDDNNKKLNSYLKSYPYFLAYFENLSKIELENVIIGINFTYAWMPTIFSFGSTATDESVSILNSAKTGNLIDVKEIQILKGCFNNSIIGASKLLHFINSEIYAIWDSNVYRYIERKEPNSKSIQDPYIYLEYLNICHQITKLEEFKEIHNSMQSRFDYKISKLRSLELIMFYHGRKIKI